MGISDPDSNKGFNRGILIFIVIWIISMSLLTIHSNKRDKICRENDHTFDGRYRVRTMQAYHSEDHERILHFNADGTPKMYNQCSLCKDYVYK